MNNKLTPAEISELKSWRNPTPEPPGPPQPPAVVIFPPAPEIMKRFSCNGANMESAVTESVAVIASKIKRIRQCFPTAANEIDLESEAIAAASGRYHARIMESFEQIAALEKLILDRASFLHSADECAKQLAYAIEQLDNPESLDLDAGELIMLTQQKKHLPAKASEAREAALKAELQIKSLVTESGIPLAVFVKIIASECRDAAGRVLNQDHYRIAKFLPLAE